MPSVAATIVHTGTRLSGKVSDSVAFCLDIRSNYLPQSSDGDEDSLIVQTLHSDMSQIKILHVVPMSSVHPSLLVGCTLHGRPPGTSANTSTVKASARFLCRETCAAMHRCARQVAFVSVHPVMRQADCGCCLEHTQTRAEFFLLVPSEDGGGVRFLLFQVASAEEVLIPPRRLAAAEVPAIEAVEDVGGHPTALTARLQPIPVRVWRRRSVQESPSRLCIKLYRFVGTPGQAAPPASLSRKTSGSKSKPKDKKSSGTTNKTKSKRKSIKSLLGFGE